MTKLYKLVALIFILELMSIKANSQVPCIADIAINSFYSIPSQGGQLQLRVHHNPPYQDNDMFNGCLIDISLQYPGSTGRVRLSYTVSQNYINVNIPINPSDIQKDNIILYIKVDQADYSCGTYYRELKFDQQGRMVAGSIGSNQSIASGALPSILTNITSASSGVSYQWQKSMNNSTWENILGATSANYQPTILYVTTYYRRNASLNGQTTHTNTLIINVNTLIAGIIGSNQTIEAGVQPSLLTNITSASSRVSYQWQKSTNNSIWDNISGATSENYQPPVLTANTYYRRAASLSNETAYSNVVTITVKYSIVPPVGFTPSNENYIISSTPIEAMDANANIKDVSKAVTSVAYFDGLGRPMQEVAVNGSATGNDLVRPIVYDAYGREEKSYLPYERTTEKGKYTTDALSKQQAFYTGLHGAADGNYAFTQNRFEASPLNRVTAVANPGKDWSLGSGHADSIVYSANAAGEVKKWKMNGNTLAADGNYEAAQLFVTDAMDADRMKVREFKDKQGNVIEKWQVDKNNAANKLITSYVYDDFNRLRVVIPPKAQSLVVNSADFNALVYRYNYDNRGRLIEKQLPGAEVERMVYDKADRLVMFQDGKMRADNGKWKITLYEVLNRPVAEGIIAMGTQSHSYFKTCFENTLVNQTRNAMGYSFNTVPGVTALTATTVISYTFYDSYDGFPARFQFAPSAFAGAAPAQATGVKGQLTGVMVKVLNDKEFTSSAKWLATVTRYDEKYRPIQVISDLFHAIDHTSYTSTISTNYLFDGAVDRVREVQNYRSMKTTIDFRFEYDHTRKPIGLYHKINNQSEVLLAQTTYDALGRAKVKTMGNAETVEYAYNIRNWLTDIKAQKFETSLYYNTSPTGLTTQKQWGGNITAATWRQNGGAQQNYRYNYDGLSRIKEGLHSGGYNEKGIEYDSNGNITKLVRDNGFYLGTYNYSYSGNKLTAINNGTAYLYDENGNTKKDGLRGFDIQYNLLNLPKAVSKGTDRLEYIYDAAGNKLVKAAKGSVTYYAGSMVYKEAGGVTSIDYIAHTEGLAVKNGSSFDYQYNLTDHLGNVRNVLDANKNSIQTNDYYPFGLTHGTPANLAKNKYLYNGKELQDDVIGGTKFDQLDYGARFYDPVTGRWYTIDPLAEKSRRWSLFAYCYNNPIRFIDPDGMEGIVVSGQPGKHNNRNHFLDNGLDRAEKALSKRQSKSEEVTWIIYNDGSEKYGFSNKQINNYTKKANELGIKVKVVNDSDDIVDYINNKTGENSREKDKITSFYYVGHSTPGDLDVGYASGSIFSGDHVEPSDFKSEAFASGTWVNLVGGCRTAVEGNLWFEKSAIDQFVDILDSKSTVHGSSVRVQYDGGVRTDQQLLKANNGKIITKKGKR